MWPISSPCLPPISNQRKRDYASSEHLLSTNQKNASKIEVFKEGNKDTKKRKTLIRSYIPSFNGSGSKFWFYLSISCNKFAKNMHSKFSINIKGHVHYGYARLKFICMQTMHIPTYLKCCKVPPHPPIHN